MIRGQTLVPPQAPARVPARVRMLSPLALTATPETLAMLALVPVAHLPQRRLGTPGKRRRTCPGLDLPAAPHPCLRRRWHPGSRLGSTSAHTVATPCGHRLGRLAGTRRCRGRCALRASTCSGSTTCSRIPRRGRLRSSARTTVLVASMCVPWRAPSVGGRCRACLSALSAVMAAPHAV